MNYHFQGFVGRKKELEWLEERINQAANQRGGIYFVSGEAGSGKSALLKNFAEQAQEENKKLVVAVSDCNAQSGISDLFLPFREILELLTGNTKSKQAKGEITPKNASRIRSMVELSASTLLEAAPDLIGSLIPGGVLLGALGKVIADKTGLTDKIRSSKTQSTPIKKSQIFEQYTNFILGISQKAPLLLIIDDMQWADESSISLLFHLGRRLEKANILILCAYRPDEVSLGRGGERHPLDKVLNELKRYYGDILIDLQSEDKEDSRKLIDEYIDLEPNVLDDNFRQALLKQTKGHPLFFVELLHYMINGQDLVQNEKGEWVEGGKLNWKALPARVEGVIEERIGRLDEESRELLQVASVEGEEFTAQVLSIIQSNEELGIVRKLSGELQKRHRLVLELGKKQIAKNTLSLFQFSHNLYQQYLYSGLGEEERRLLHKAVAQALEDLDPDNDKALAYHFEEASEFQQAIKYFRRAGSKAMEAFVYFEAGNYFEKALKLSKKKDDRETVIHLALTLGQIYQSLYEFERSKVFYAEAFEYQKKASPVPRKENLPKAPHALRLHMRGHIMLDPVRSNDSESGEFLDQLFEPLLKLTRDNRIIPGAAESWTIDNSGQHLEFKLRENGRWNDGAAVTASDFVSYFRRKFSPENDELHAAQISEILNGMEFRRGEIGEPDQIGVRALNELTLAIELKRPSPQFLYALTGAFPLPQHSMEKYGARWSDPTNLVGNGPFELTEYTEGERARLTKRKNYVGEFQGNCDEIFYYFTSKKFDAVEAFKNDELDLMFPYVLPDRKTNDRARHTLSEAWFSHPSDGLAYLQFNSLKSPFNDQRVRQAFAHALNKDKLAATVFQSIPAEGGFAAPPNPGHSKGIGLKHDPTLAKQLLSDAGFPEGKNFPEIKFVSFKSPIAKMRNKEIEGQLNEHLGLRLNIELYSVDQLPNVIKNRDFHITFLVWGADFPDPETYIPLFNMQPEADWKTAQYDEKFQKYRSSISYSDHIENYKMLEKEMIALAPIIPIQYLTGGYYVKPWVKNWSLNDRYYSNIIIEEHDS